MYVVGGTSTAEYRRVCSRARSLLASTRSAASRSGGPTSRTGTSTTSSSGGTNLNILEDGNIVFAWNYKIALLDRDTGAIIKARNLPAPGPVTPRSINYKELTVAPDGTIILRSQNRPENCNQQGGGGLTTARSRPAGPSRSPRRSSRSTPKTLEIYDRLVCAGGLRHTDRSSPPTRARSRSTPRCWRTRTASSGIRTPRS